MTPLKRAATISIVLCLGVFLSAPSPGAVDTNDKEDLRILYAGLPGGAREKDFVDFLSQHFAHVEAGDFTRFAGKDAEGFDVVILDYEGDGRGAPMPELSVDYARPTVTVGVPGSHVCSRLNLKLRYL
ncbi:MAG: hypothetical protein ACYTAN_03085 [Planctomycetota bacterium]|jgi:hypothetical protein